MLFHENEGRLEGLRKVKKSNMPIFHWFYKQNASATPPPLQHAKSPSRTQLYSY
jgi:hypothetical protein